MKKLKALAILLLIITALHYVASAQTYKVKIPKTDKAWIFVSLDDNKRVATLVGSTLYVHKTDSIKIVEQSNELRYLKRNGVTYRYQFAYIDKTYFYQNLKGGVAIW